MKAFKYIPLAINIFIQSSYIDNYELKNNTLEKRMK